MTCEERKDLIGLHATGSLGPADEAELRSHIQTGCPDCAAFLAEVEDTLALLPLGLAPVKPEARVKSRLMGRLETPVQSPEASRVMSVVPESGRPARPRFRFVEALLGGALAASLAIVAFSHWAARDRRSIEDLRNQVATQQQRIDSLQSSGDLQSLRVRVAQDEQEIRELKTNVAEAEQTMRRLQSPGVLMVSAEGTPVQPGAQARVYLDRPNRTLHLFASGLQPLDASKTYELWLINDHKKPIPAGTFSVNSRGEASLQQAVPEEAGKIALVAVTAEPAGGLPVPSGAIVVKGAVQ